MTPQRPTAGQPDNRGQQPGMIISPAGGFSWLEENAGAPPSSRQFGKRDQRILLSLLRLNRDAALVFEKAEKSAVLKEVQVPLSELKKLHQSIAANIAARVQDFGVPEDPETRHFGVLDDEPACGPEAETIGRLVEAEDRCLARMETALDDGLSMNAQVFLATQLEELGWAYKHMKALKATVNKETCQ